MIDYVKTNRLAIAAELLDDEENASISFSAKKIFDSIDSPKSSKSKNLCRQIWPALEHHSSSLTRSPALRVLPLNRLGAEEGKSKARVFVGYFFDLDSNIVPSKPMVIKLGTKVDDICKNEYEVSQRLLPYTEYSPGRFAIPIAYHNASSQMPFPVLWSPFSSSKRIWEATSSTNDRLDLGISDIWGRLSKRNEGGVLNLDGVGEIIASVFHMMRPFHLKCGVAKRTKINAPNEYAWYLRNVDSKDGWSKDLHACWGSAKTTSDFGTRWTNPFWVLRKTKNISFEGFCGCVHGDLHPKNIVLADDGSPRIIDFEWASETSHLAKDFVLLECNLRFVTLDETLEFDQLLKFAKWLKMDSQIPEDLTCDYLKELVQLIGTVRLCAKTVFPQKTRWTLEYVLPMFYVALGLFKYSNDFGSQVSARLHLLCLADYLKRNLKLT